LKRQFMLARHKYAFYDPVSGVHLTLDRPVSPVLNDEVVDVRRLERAVRLGSLIELTRPNREPAKPVAQQHAQTKSNDAATTATANVPAQEVNVTDSLQSQEPVVQEPDGLNVANDELEVNQEGQSKRGKGRK